MAWPVFLAFVSRLRVRSHAEASRKWWSRQVIPWIGFDVNSQAVRFGLTSEEQETGEVFTLRWASLLSGTILRQGDDAVRVVPELPGMAGARRVLLLAKWAGPRQTFGRDGKVQAACSCCRLSRPSVGWFQE